MVIKDLIVLILIYMEYTIGVCQTRSCIKECKTVLILIYVEYTIGVMVQVHSELLTGCLNPYLRGIYYRRAYTISVCISSFCK